MNTNNYEFKESSLYAIKESHNLAMLTAATSVSALLNGNVWITNPESAVSRIMDFIYADLSPSVFVKLTYSGGFEGSAIIIFKQSDAQLMLAQLMGMPLVATPDFVFDEINISAFGEVISQMMSSYFTEISGLIGNSIVLTNTEVIPHAANQNIFMLMGLSPDDSMCSITSSLRIDNTINSKFITILSPDFASEVAEKTESRFPLPAPDEPVIETPEKSEIPDLSSPPEKNNPFDTTGANEPSSLFSMSPNDEANAFNSPMNTHSPFDSLSERPVSFSSFQNTLTQDQLNNLQLLMNVPLELSIEIGSTQRKVDDILSFSHGTIIELDSPADAPVNVIVNGHLIAKGDVVVVDDYFAVRVTEIIQSNLIDTLRNGE